MDGAKVKLENLRLRAFSVFMFASEYYLEMRQLRNFRAAREVLKELTGSGITQEWKSPWSPRMVPDDVGCHGARERSPRTGVAMKPEN